jgi:alginate O-acetyltransferase complex protein AlgJ
MISMTPDTIAAPSKPQSPSPLMRRIANRLFAAVFLLSIFVPLVGVFLHWDSAESNENRRLSSLPGAPRTLAQITSFSDNFLSFYRDHFGLRNTLTRAVALARVRGLGDDTGGEVLLGKEGWLFLRPDGDSNLIATRGLNPLTESQLDAWQSVLEKRRAYLAARGIPYLLVIPPDKPSIYPEFLPDNYAPLIHVSRLDQLLARLRDSHSPVDVVDVRPALLAAKPSHLLFHPTDTHWNDWGAFIAYQQIIIQVQKILPQWHIVPQTRDDFFIGKPTPWPGDLARMMDMPDKYPETDVPLLRKKPYPTPDELAIRNNVVTIDNHDRSLPSIVFYRDSFAIALVPMLGPHFNRIVYAFHYTMDPALIAQSKPDLVIDEFLERNLFLDPPKDPNPIRDFNLH